MSSAWKLETTSNGQVPMQTPAAHWSMRVAALPSLHTVPFGRGTFAQPVGSWQVPVLHWSVRELQFSGVPEQLPVPVHLSVVVQTKPSLQLKIADFGTGTHWS